MALRLLLLRKAVLLEPVHDLLIGIEWGSEEEEVPKRHQSRTV